MKLQLGNIDQDAAWIVSAVDRVIRVTTHDGFVQGDFLVISPILNCYSPSFGGLILNLVQVIDHQPVAGSAWLEKSSGHA